MASSSKVPAAGRAGVQNSTGHNSGKTIHFHDPGQGITAAHAPASANTARPQGGMAIDTLAKGQVAIQPNMAAMGSSAQDASCHAPGHNTPNKANGVTSKVTQGMAHKFANKPTTDT